MNLDLRYMTKLEKKLLYIHNIKPVLNKGALYSDETAVSRNPVEPEPYSEVTIRLRTGTGNIEHAYICYDNNEYDMFLAGADELFDYYEYSLKLEDKQIRYYFRVQTGSISCFYDKRA